MDSTSKIAVVAALAVLTVVTIYLIATATGAGPLAKFGIGIVDVFAIGLMLQAALKLKGGYGIYLIGTKRGIKAVDRLSKRYLSFWNAMTMWGLTLGFGLLAYPLVKGKIDKRVYLFGIASSFLIYLFLVPYLQNAYVLINIPQLQSAISGGAAVAPSLQLTITQYAVLAINIVTGFSGTLIATLFLHAGTIFVSLAQYLGSVAAGSANSSGIASQPPGVAPIIPGIDIPLFPGIIALAIILIIHEFSHGILARTVKIKIKSIGLLLFGTIPIGAFVEPDEKAVNKLDSLKQTKIFAAGVSANFIATVIFAGLTLLMATYVLPGAYGHSIVVAATDQGYPAANVLQPGMQILSWNGQNATNLTAVTAAAAKDVPGGLVTVVTNTGTYSFTAVPQPGNTAHGVIGISIGLKALINTVYGGVVNFLYILFLLSMLLNFLVAIVNLLPLPGFDGWRIYKANIKNNNVIKLVTVLILIGIVLNAVPWLFYY